jgi:hypothetical protein
MDSERREIANEITDARERVADDIEAIGQPGREAKSIAMSLLDNPLAMLLAGLGAGLLVGFLLPVSRKESERIPPIAEDLKRRGTEVIKETLEGGHPLQS